VNVAPTATPKIVRIASLITRLPRIGTPTGAAIRQAMIGPNSQASGKCNQRNMTTPIAAIDGCGKWDHPCIAFSLWRSEVCKCVSAAVPAASASPR